MASPQRMKNPHLRAKLTEVLEELIPKVNQSQSFRMNTIEYNSDIYQAYQHKQYLIPCLVHVFVSIELTGQSVAFEQKFQYRRSIYAVLEYLWNDRAICAVYKQSMVDLSKLAYSKIEESNLPLFLRFINLMANVSA
jgi:ubiquitin conjugation factor E4 A